MSTNKTFSTETSERYSRALFEVAKEADELDKTENDVKNFQSYNVFHLRVKFTSEIIFLDFPSWRSPK